MAVDIITIPRVYLKDRSLWHSAHHTAYSPAPGLPDAKPGTEQQLVSLIFELGVARNVPKNIYDMFAAMGIATTDRPKRQWELDEDERQ